ncbi:MAG: hypothetical protein AB7L90_17430 [Hyphomicrobiaceae bacterium]
MMQMGLRLCFGSFEELMSANRANSKTWRPLLPSFDPTFSKLTKDDSICIFGRDASGNIVATQAVRLFSWTDTNFFAEAENLRLFYADPAASRGLDEWCHVTAEPTRSIDGRVLFSGAGWYRPDYRGKGLGVLMPRIARLYALSRWYIDFAVCIMADGVVKGGFPKRAGYRHVDWDLMMHRMPVHRDGTVRAAAVWMDTQDTLRDLDQMLLRLGESQVDGAIENVGGQDRDVIRPTGSNR